MKTKLLTLLLGVFAITSLYAQSSGTCGSNLKWSFNYSDSTLTITGKGDMTNWTSAAYVPWRNYRGRIKHISFPTGITSIGDYAFSNCSKLESINIPDKVTTIGKAAFWDCSDVDSVVIPENVSTIKIQAFANSVKSVIINSNKFVSKDYETTSDNCKAIFGDQVRKYTFGPNITKIGKYAFSRCTNVDEIIIPDNIQTVSLYAFENCSIKSVIIGTGVSDCDYTFGGCSKLKTVKINSNKFFNRQVNIASVFGTQVEKFFIGDSVYSMGKLEGCIQLNTLVIGKNVTEIGDIANCPSLTSITIPENVVTIGGRGKFKGNTNLKTIIWNAKHVVVNSIYDYDAPLSEIASQIKTFIIGDSVEVIPNMLCMNMNNITSISFPEKLKSINLKAFYGCSGLTCPIVIPDSVTCLGRSAFSGCTNIPSAVIGNGITNIDVSTFEECSNLSSISIGKSVTHIDNSAFYKCSMLSGVVWNAINCEDFVEDKTPFWNIGTLDEDIRIAWCIRSFTFGDEVQSIPAYLCCQMELSNITIPSSVTRIGTKAFYKSYSAGFCHITNFLGMVPNLASDIGWATQGVFSECDRIYVPCGSLEYYKEKIIHPFPSMIQNNPSLYTLNLITNPEQGTIVSNVEPTICDSIIEIAAIPNEGYHFVRWNDGLTTSPRSVSLTQDTTFTAQFAINQYSITVSCNPQQGSIEGENGTFNHGTELTYKANANEGYHFVQWSDKVLDNPRTILLTHDSILSAEFAINTYIVQFFGFDNVLLDSQSVDHGTAAVAPEPPSVEDYDFMGWDKKFTYVTSNLDIFAIYQKNTEDVENVSIDAIPHKVLRNGQILILRGNKTYTLTGQEVK